MRCAIYVRVSREEQIEGWSLDAQLEQCRALAALRHWQIERVYEEPGRSAKTDLRPAFQRLMHHAAARLCGQKVNPYVNNRPSG